MVQRFVRVSFVAFLVAFPAVALAWTQKAPFKTRVHDHAHLQIILLGTRRRLLEPRRESQLLPLPNAHQIPERQENHSPDLRQRRSR
jgi:hypothetical protein